jgi:XRE family aerobic/anaerobic benzoate catabolism transcriptional regulator
MVAITPISVASDGSEVEAFVASVGDRVRKARERRGITRKALSAASGVSLRYLAQLENGGGNISIALLRKVAMALGHRVEWFVSEDDPWTSDSAQLLEWFRTANDEQKQRVLGLLSPRKAVNLKKQRICLLGLRGAGKSSLGKLASEQLQLPFLEINSEIQRLSGMPIHELINFYGQEGYRRIEKQAIEGIVADTDSVLLATAGGIVAEPTTYQYLLNHFNTIWLKASPDEHMSRVRQQGDERPMVGNPQAMEQLKSILTSREALYTKADFTINTSARSLKYSTEELVQAIGCLHDLD